MRKTQYLSLIIAILCLSVLVSCANVDPYLIQSDGEWPTLQSTLSLELETVETTSEEAPREVLITPPTTTEIDLTEDYLYEVDESMSAIAPIAGRKAENHFKGVLLTFDDVPSDNTPALLEQLKSADAKAVFFINSERLDDPKSRAIVQSIHDAGHTLGNGGMPGMSNYATDKQKDVLVEISRLIRKVSGQYPTMFRPLWADYTTETVDIIHEVGMSLLTWGYCFDAAPEYQNAYDLTSISLSTNLLQPGVVVLMHPYQWTIDAIPELVNGYRAQGYEIIDPSKIAPYDWERMAKGSKELEPGEKGEAYYQPQDDIPAAGHQ